MVIVDKATTPSPADGVTAVGQVPFSNVTGASDPNGQSSAGKTNNRTNTGTSQTFSGTSIQKMSAGTSQPGTRGTKTDPPVPGSGVSGSGTSDTNTGQRASESGTRGTKTDQPVSSSGGEGSGTRDNKTVQRSGSNRSGWKRNRKNGSSRTKLAFGTILLSLTTLLFFL